MEQQRVQQEEELRLDRRVLLLEQRQHGEQVRLEKGVQRLDEGDGRRQRYGLENGLDEHGERVVPRERRDGGEGGLHDELEDGHGGEEGGGEHGARLRVLDGDGGQQVEEGELDGGGGVQQRGEQRLEERDQQRRRQPVQHVLGELLREEEEKQGLVLHRGIRLALQPLRAARDLPNHQRHHALVVVAAELGERGEVAAVRQEALDRRQVHRLVGHLAGHLAQTLVLDVLHVVRRPAETQRGAHQGPVKRRGGVEAVEGGEEVGAVLHGERHHAEEVLALELDDERGGVGDFGGDHEHVLVGDGAVEVGVVRLDDLVDGGLGEVQEACGRDGVPIFVD